MYMGCALAHPTFSKFYILCLFLDAFAKLRKATISFFMSACLFVRPSVRPFALKKSASTGRIFMEFLIWVLFENISRKFKFHWNLTRIADTLQEGQYTFMIISCLVLLRIRNISDKTGTENQTCILYSTIFFSSKIVPFMRQCRKISYSLTDDRRQYDAGASHPKATITLSENVILFHCKNGCTNAP